MLYGNTLKRASPSTHYQMDIVNLSFSGFCLPPGEDELVKPESSWNEHIVLKRGALRMTDHNRPKDYTHGDIELNQRKIRNKANISSTKASGEHNLQSVLQLFETKEAFQTTKSAEQDRGEKAGTWESMHCGSSETPL